MIQIMFEKMGDKILVVVEGTRVLFGNTRYGAALADISGLQLSREGVIKEHPDLAESGNWKEKAISRLTEKLKSYSTDDERVSYIIEDLRKHDFKPLFIQKKGHRPEAVK